MSILQSILFGLLLGSNFKLLKIIKEHKKRLEKLEGKNEADN